MSSFIKGENYRQVADKAGLTGKVKERYLKYMQTRWANTEWVKSMVGYAGEWAERFAARREYTASDIQGQAILNTMEGQNETSGL